MAATNATAIIEPMATNRRLAPNSPVFIGESMDSLLCRNKPVENGSMNQAEDAGRWMAEAVRLSREGMRRNVGGPFGCVVVRNGEIIGHGCNEVIATNDPTAHAEIVAIHGNERRGSASGRGPLEDCEIYASCEPCPMCLAAIYWARIRMIYYAGTRDDAASIGFDDAEFYRQISLEPGVRQIPMTQVSRESVEVYAEWRGKAPG